MFFETTRSGMPIRRWVFLGGVFGPVAIFLMRVHYRRAMWRLTAGSLCCWLA